MNDAFARASLPRVAAYAAAVVALGLATLYFATSGARDPESPLVCATDADARRSTIIDTAVGDAALLGLDHTPVMLHALAGTKLTVLLFVAYRCPCSDGYVARLGDLRDRYERRGVSFTAIDANADETIDGMKSYVNRRRYPWRMIRDEDGLAADLVHADVTPEVFVFTPDWRLRYHGRIDDDKSGMFVTDRSLAGALDTLLAGGRLATTEKLIRGCAIVRTVPSP